MYTVIYRRDDMTIKMKEVKLSRLSEEIDFLINSQMLILSIQPSC